MGEIWKDKGLDFIVGIVVALISKYIVDNSEIELLDKITLIVVSLLVFLLFLFRKNIIKVVKEFESKFKNIEKVEELRNEIETQRKYSKLKIEEQQVEVYQKGEDLKNLNETLGKIIDKLIDGIDKLVLAGEGEESVEQSKKDILLSEVKELQEVFQDLQKLQNFTTEFSRDLDEAAKTKALNETMSQEDADEGYKIYTESKKEQEKISKN